MQPHTILVAATALAACSAVGPHTAEVMSRAVPDGSGRLCVLREKQTLYSFLPVEISVDGRAIGTLRSGTYLATDLPPGAHGLTVAALISRATANFDLTPAKTTYVDVAMTPSGLPPPRGAIGAAPAYPITAEAGLFSIHFLEAREAAAKLADLTPSD